MNVRNKVLDCISAIDEVERVQIKAEESMPNGEYLMLLYVYLSPRGPTPPTLGVHVAEKISTKDTIR